MMYQKIKKSLYVFLIASLVLTDMIVFISACSGNTKSDNSKTTQNTLLGTPTGNRQTDAQTPPNAATDNRIPAKVYRVLDYVRQNKAPMNGYVGGRNFGNFERRLPAKDATGRKMKYQEWDVNPKKNGKNRGVERLITGANGQAWFTNDHYATFIEIKN